MTDLEVRSALPTRAYPRASWGRRALAWLLDAVVVAVPVSVIVTAAGFGATVTVRAVNGHVISARSLVGLEQQLLEAVVWLITFIAYGGITEGGLRGQTIGKRWVGIATVSVDGGGPIGFGRAAVRTGVCAGLLLLGVVPGVLNALAPLRDPERRALHDRITSSVVIEVASS